MIVEGKNFLRNSMNFLRYELQEEKNKKTLDIFYKDKINKDFRAENPNLVELNINIKFKGLEHIENSNDALISKAKKNLVTNSNFYDYLILKDILFNEDNEAIEVVLIKNMKTEKLFFEKIIFFFLIILLITLTLSFFIAKYFIQKIDSEFLNLKNFNENISLENLKITNNNSKIIEFNDIWSSYEEMLKRLENEKNSQIEFIHNASHELKTPIFVIASYITLLKKTVSENSLEYLNDIESKNNEMANLVEKLLFIAKSSKIKLDFSEIELSEIILKLIHQFKFSNYKFNIKFIPKYAVINSDEILIKTLLKNLLENAIKYGDNKEIFITIFTLNKNIVVKIKDLGFGISSIELQHIFKKFYRSDFVKNKNIAGHGLGMSIVKNIISLLDIKLKIYSQPFKGTTIYLIFKNKKD